MCVYIYLPIPWTIKLNKQVGKKIIHLNYLLTFLKIGM